MRPRITAIRAFVISLLPAVLAVVSPAGANPSTKQSAGPVSVVRIWHIPDVKLVYDLPVFWGDHLMAVTQQNRHVLALDLSTGKELWSRPLPAGIMASQIARVGDQLIVMTEHLIEGVNSSTGVTEWTTELPCAPPSTARLADGLAILPCTPLVASTGAQIRKTPIIGLDMRKGQIRWQFQPTHAVYWEQTGHDRYFFLDSVRRDSGRPSPGSVTALSVSTGEVLWRRDLRDAIGRLAVVGNTLVVSASRILGLSTETGKVIYEKSAGPEPDVYGMAEDASSELLVCDGAFFVLGPSGIEVISGETGLRRDFLRYPPNARPRTAKPGSFLLCEGSQLLMVTWRDNGQHQVFLRDGKAWRTVLGLAAGESIKAFASGQIIVESESGGLTGYAAPGPVSQPNQ